MIRMGLIYSLRRKDSRRFMNSCSSWLAGICRCSQVCVCVGGGGVALSGFAIVPLSYMHNA